MAERLAGEILSLPMYPGITEGQQRRVAGFAGSGSRRPAWGATADAAHLVEVGATAVARSLLAGLFAGRGDVRLGERHVQPEYRATGQMMFLLPPEQPDPEDPPVNPYLNLPEGMGATANLIAGMVTTDDVAAQPR